MNAGLIDLRLYLWEFVKCHGYILLLINDLKRYTIGNKLTNQQQGNKEMTKIYVKKHKGHDVPDGAAHYNDKNRCFYNKDKTRYYNTECVGNGWTDLNFKAYAENSTELPEQDLPNWDDAPEWADGVALAPWNNDLMLWFNGDKYQYIDALKTDSVYAMEDDNFIEYHMKRPIAIEDKEWDGKGSKVGKRVRATAVSSNEWENCLVKFCDKHSDIVVVRFDGHSEDTPLRLPWRFLPLKTAEELEREAFIEDGLNIVMKLKSLINPNEGVLSLALYGLFDAGFTAPKN